MYEIVHTERNVNGGMNPPNPATIHGQFGAPPATMPAWPPATDRQPRPRRPSVAALRADNRELEAVACPAPEADPDMPYQIIDVAMARSLQEDAARDFIRCPPGR
jgi:hypothetical protein